MCERLNYVPLIDEERRQKYLKLMQHKCDGNMHCVTVAHQSCVASRLQHSVRPALQELKNGA